MKFLKYVVVIVAYEIICWVISAVFGISLTLLGILGPEVSLSIQGLTLMLTNNVAFIVSILAVAWAATRYDDWHVAKNRPMAP